MSIVGSIKVRANLLKANIINSYNIDTSYFFENIASVGSTLFYTITLLLFLKIIYYNIDTFAGYKENEILFLMLVGQTHFYTSWLWSVSNMNHMMDEVRTGSLDTILVKPVPSLFFLTFMRINIISMLRDGLPNILILVPLIKWSELHISLSLALIGIVIFILGQVAWHCFRFLASLSVFFVGKSYQISKLAETFSHTNNIPLEGFPGKLRTVFTTVIPTLISTQMSVSVMLGKSKPLPMFITALSIMVVFLLVLNFMWGVSLKNYTSASS